MTSYVSNILQAPHDFEWIPGVTPLSSYRASAAITGAYLFAIYGIKVDCLHIFIIMELILFIPDLHAASHCIRLDYDRCNTQFCFICIFLGCVSGLYLQVIILAADLMFAISYFFKSACPRSCHLVDPGLPFSAKALIYHPAAPPNLSVRLGIPVHSSSGATFSISANTTISSTRCFWFCARKK